jgi:hypothetical protein
LYRYNAAMRSGDASHSADGLDYVFSHFCGIFLTTLCYFVLYCAGKSAAGQKPELPPCVLPAFLSGLMWGVAQVGLFTPGTVDFPGLDSALPRVSVSCMDRTRILAVVNWCFDCAK